MSNSIFKGFQGVGFFFKILNFFSRDFKGFFKGCSFSRVSRFLKGSGHPEYNLHNAYCKIILALTLENQRLSKTLVQKKFKFND